MEYNTGDPDYVNAKKGPKYQCPVCKQILQSTYRWHLDMCDCDNKAFVDGGGDYTRAGAVDDFPVLFVEAESDETI